MASLRCCNFAVAMALSLVGTTPHVAYAAQAQVSVEQALASILAQHPSLQAQQQQHAAATAAAQAARGGLLPRLYVSDTQQWYATKFHAKGALGALLSSPALAAFPENLNTNLFVVAASQPLLGLLQRIPQYQALCAAAEASQHAVQLARANMAADVRIYFLRLFEAQAVQDTAAAAQQDLEEQVRIAQRTFEAGSLTIADVLRLKVAAAAAKQQVIAAQAQVTSLRALLLEALGRGEDDHSVEFIAPGELSQAPELASLHTARQAALQNRLELQQAAAQAQAAAAMAQARGWALLPEISLQASFVYAGLQSFDAPPVGNLRVPSKSIGLKADWAIWEWGSSWYGYQQSQAQAAAARAQVMATQQNIGADVAAHHAAWQAARSAVDVASAQVDSSDEAYRVMQALTTAGSATTTDLLDAAAARTSSRLSLVHARFEVAVAQVQLTRASGATLW